MSRTILVTGAIGQTDRINFHDVHAVTGRNPVAFAQFAAAGAGAWRR